MIIVIIACTFACTKVAGQKIYTQEELTSLIEDCQFIKTNAATMAASARNLGWTDDDKLIKDLQSKWQNANEDEQTYTVELEQLKAKEAEQIEQARWEAKMAEYPVATTVWKKMKAQGWNDYVCAGIMGNMMAEVGGQTLNLKWNASGNGYYGLCQWNQAYASKVWGASVEGQCDFLISSIKYEIDTYGSKYQKGFNFNSFLNLQDCRAASQAFALSYERCSAASHSKRQDNAVIAYNYFTN